MIVVGMNSIAIYCMSMLLKSWIARQLETHLGGGIFTLCGVVDYAFSPALQALMVGLVFWLAGYYMYRNKFFLCI